MGCVSAPHYNLFKMLSIGEFLELYPELRGLDRNTQLLAYEIYLEEGDLNIKEFLTNIK